jgi:DNA-binding response OmpR family regulator
MHNKNILVVEDETDLLELISYQLTEEGYNVFKASDGDEALSTLHDEVIDLALLDIMLPSYSGTDLCKKIKRDDRLKSIPVIFLTAKGQEEDVLRGFQLGADDYLTKPFSVNILLARIEAILNRTQGNKGNYQLGDLHYLPDRHIVKIAGSRVSMTPRELKVLDILIKQKNKTVSRSTLLEKGWGLESTSGLRSVDIIITRIRSKIKPYGRCIQTVTGFGYQWDEESHENEL